MEAGGGLFFGGMLGFVVQNQMMLTKIGFGGGCHWCTEAVFQQLKGVAKVEQGWIASSDEHQDFSEAVLVHFDSSVIDLASLIAIHLYTHSCTSNHALRVKYRSAIYSFTQSQYSQSQNILTTLQSEFEKPIITKVLPFINFKGNKEQYQNYYQKNSENTFCKSYINPKFKILMQKFSKHLIKN